MLRKIRKIQNPKGVGAIINRIIEQQDADRIIAGKNIRVAKRSGKGTVIEGKPGDGGAGGSTVPRWG
jgi:hypothetical protein